MKLFYGVAARRATSAVDNEHDVLAALDVEGEREEEIACAIVPPLLMLFLPPS